MKNKKILKILLFSLIFTITSCGNIYNGDQLPHLDGTTFEHLSSFTIDGVDYSLSLPKNDDTFYMYKQSEFKTSTKMWTINYTYEVKYILDDSLTYQENLFNEIYNQLNNNISKINGLVNDEITLYKYNELVTFEETLINDLNGEVSFMYYDQFLPIKLVNLDEQYSYNISIPIDRLHLLMNESSIQNPFDDGYISLTDFYNLPKSIENKIY